MSDRRRSGDDRPACSSPQKRYCRAVRAGPRGRQPQLLGPGSALRQEAPLGRDDKQFKSFASCHRVRAAASRIATRPADATSASYAQNRGSCARQPHQLTCWSHTNAGRVKTLPAGLIADVQSIRSLLRDRCRLVECDRPQRHELGTKRAVQVQTLALAGVDAGIASSFYGHVDPRQLSRNPTV